MALPSQSARPTSRRTHMHRRSGQRHLSRRLIAGIVLSVAAVVVVVVWMRWDGGDGGAGSDPADLVAARPSVPTAGPAGDSGPPGPLDRPDDRTSDRAGEIDDDADDEDEPRRSGDPASIEMGASAPPPPAAPSVLARAEERLPDSEATAAERRPAGEPDRAGRPETARRASRRVQAGLDLMARNEPIEARRVLSLALDSGVLDRNEAFLVREKLTEINDRLVFGPVIVQEDPFALRYTIEPNDRLSKIPGRMGVLIDWRFIQRINRIPSPERIQAGQSLKLITGPFHAVVDKSDFRMDVFLGDGPDRVFVCSFPVGLGADDGTPEGRFRVRPQSKLINPLWRNPRDGTVFEPDNPLNPIGERWLGLVADEERLSDVVGYGIHGTIEPETIGHEASMGCIRMSSDDVEIVWELLMEDVSTVQIVR